MAEDIVERLHEWQDYKDGGDKSYPLYLVLGEAAEEIKRLRHQVDRFTAALSDIEHLTEDHNVLHRIKESRRV